MRPRKRFDGTEIKGLPAFTIVNPIVMPSKLDAAIYFEQELDVTETMEYIHDVNKELIKRREILTLFEVVMCATARTIALRPRLNRFIMRRRYYQRNRITFNFIAKKELTDEGEEVSVKIPFGPFETLETVARTAKRYIKKATSGEGLKTEELVNFFARFSPGLLKVISDAIDWLDSRNVFMGDVVETDPMWCSVFLTNVGSFGIEAPFHHLYERGNCHFFMAVGKVRTEFVIGAGGKAVPRRKLTLRYTYDDRIADGIYMATSLEILKRFIEHPAELSKEPELDEALVRELALDERLYREAAGDDPEGAGDYYEGQAEDDADARKYHRTRRVSGSGRRPQGRADDGGDGEAEHGRGGNRRAVHGNHKGLVWRAAQRAADVKKRGRHRDE